MHFTQLHYSWQYCIIDMYTHDYETYVTCINFRQLFYVAKKNQRKNYHLFHKMFATKIYKVVITHCSHVNFWPVIYGSLSIFWLTVGTTTSITHCFLEGVSNKTVFLVQKLPCNIIKTDFYLQMLQLLSTLQKVALILGGPDICPINLHPDI